MVDVNGKWPPDRDEFARLLGVSSLIKGCILSSDATNLYIGAGQVSFNYEDVASGVFKSTGIINYPGATIPIASLPKTVSAYMIFINEDFSISYDPGAGFIKDINSKRVYVGLYVTDGSVIQSLINLTNVSQTNIPEALRDLQYTLRPLRRSGLEIGASTAGNPMQIEIQEGEILIIGSSVKTVESGGSANIINIPNITLPNYYYQYRDGAGDWVIDFTGTEIDPTKWDDDSGTLKTVPAKKWTVQRVYGDNAFNLYVNYGQSYHNSLEEAAQSISITPFYKNALNEFSYFLGYLIIRKNCSDLNDTSTCAIVLPQFVNGEINVRQY